jgi:hypothetical protein
VRRSVAARSSGTSILTSMAEECTRVGLWAQRGTAAFRPAALHLGLRPRVGRDDGEAHRDDRPGQRGGSRCVCVARHVRKLRNVGERAPAKSRSPVARGLPNTASAYAPTTRKRTSWATNARNRSRKSSARRIFPPAMQPPLLHAQSEGEPNPLGYRQVLPPRFVGIAECRSVRCARPNDPARRAREASVPGLFRNRRHPARCRTVAPRGRNRWEFPRRRSGRRLVVRGPL